MALTRELLIKRIGELREQLMVAKEQFDKADGALNEAQVMLGVWDAKEAPPEPVKEIKQGE